MEAESKSEGVGEPAVEVLGQGLQALRLVLRDGVRAYGTVGVLGIPAILVGGLSLSLLIAPLFPALFAAQHAPLTLVDALKPLQVHSFFIYAGILGVWMGIYRALILPLIRAALLNRLMGLGVGEHLSSTEAWLRLFPNLPELFQTLGQKWSRVLGGSLLGVLPGVVWACFSALAELVCLMEGRAGPEALRRSRRWMEGPGNLSRYLRVQVLLWLLWAGLALGLGGLWRMLLGAPEGFLSWSFQLALPGLLLLPFETAQDFVYYADLQVRRRHFERLFQKILVHSERLEQVLVE